MKLSQAMSALELCLSQDADKGFWTTLFDIVKTVVDVVKGVSAITSGDWGGAFGDFKDAYTNGKAAYDTYEDVQHRTFPDDATAQKYQDTLSSFGSALDVSVAATQCCATTMWGPGND